MQGKHMFAGVNTPDGFYSRFQDIMPESVTGRKIYIKGGPGTGKSTLMKRIAQRAGELDLEYEVFHCSSDPASIDGVHIPELEVAVLDATAPHGSDPEFPGAGGELFDVSGFIDKEKLLPRAEEMRFYAAKKKRAFAKGYQYLKAAKPLMLDMENEYREAADLRGISEEGERLAQRIFGHASCKGDGLVRRLFISAITPEGFVNYADTVFADAHVVSVKGVYGSHIVLGRVADMALSRGFTPILFYCPMQPEKKLEHIYIPQLRTAVSTYDLYTHCSGRESVDLDSFVRFSAELGEPWGHASALYQRAIDAFSEAKTFHSLLESIYVPAMCFDKLEEKAKELLASIF